MWNNSHWKHTGDLQKDSYATKAVKKKKKIQMELSRKGREAIVLGLVFLRGNIEEEKDYRLENYSWGLKD